VADADVLARVADVPAARTQVQAQGQTMHAGVGNFSEQVWGDSPERRQHNQRAVGITTQRRYPWPGRVPTPSLAHGEQTSWRCRDAERIVRYAPAKKRLVLPGEVPATL